jgi:hypothetical protein
VAVIEKQHCTLSPTGERRNRMTTEEEIREYKYTIAKLQLEIKQLNAECVEIYGLLGHAHLNIKQHLEYGFNPLTAKSTLISVGRYAPKLRAEMEKKQND